MATRKSDDFTPILPIQPAFKSESRTSNLRKHFYERFSQEPEFFVRVPGRVNIIGEHIDYCGYSVCPMAIKQDILLAVSTCKDSFLCITNEDPKYSDYKCDLNTLSIDVNTESAPLWYNYFLCGIKGIIDALPDGHKVVAIKAAVSGTIPTASGLSSSSALVSAAALALAHANKLSFTKLEIASLCANSERFIGTQGGGMDQAIAFLGTKGTAKHIEFNPLRCEDIVLPPNAVFVIANSLAEMNKAATSDFNCRVAECRLASQLLAKKCKLHWTKFNRLSDLQNELNISLERMITLVKDLLHVEPYTKSEVCEEFSVTEEELNELSLTKNTIHIKEFKLHQRALHVFEEANRVKMFCDLCKEDSSNSEVLAKLGRLMHKSHESLQNLYECSHPLLDEIVEISKGTALGCRLTGAGWGGCAIALLEKGKEEEYIKLLTNKFYATHPKCNNKNVKLFVFSTEPENGAIIYNSK